MGLKAAIFSLLKLGGKNVKYAKAGMEELGYCAKAGSKVSSCAKLTSKESAALSNIGGASKVKIGDGFAKTMEGRIKSSTLFNGEQYHINPMEIGKKFRPNSAYRATTEDVLQIGGTRLKLSDPRIVEALRKKGPGGKIVVGREPGCDVIINDPSVSGAHLVIQHKVPGSKRLYIENLNSTNGTFATSAAKYTNADRAADSALFDRYLKHLEPSQTVVEVKEVPRFKQNNNVKESNKPVDYSSEQRAVDAAGDCVIAENIYNMGHVDDIGIYEIMDDVVDFF